ncbi:hypothetical protein HRbin09_01659 [bacterium HR09]|nr:hypothetical protein HRbin09_01659 [bacterium HR09]
MHFADSLLAENSGGGSGTITGVTAGQGLTGGGTSGNVTLAVANGGITSGMLADNSVTSAKIVDGSVQTADLANAAVTASKISGTGATSDRVLKYDGSAVVWGVDEQGGLTLPYSGSANTAGHVFWVTNDGSGTAINGNSPSGTGVRGFSSMDGTGVYGFSTSGTAVKGLTTSGSAAVYGDSGKSDGRGVYGVANSALAMGVHGHSDYGRGVAGGSNTGRGVYGWTASGLAGFFEGNVQVTANLFKGGGSFKIDHPLDPEHKYLYHSFVESPDMKNVYDGNVVLDQNGEAWVELPEWFEALNRDFRYQLTALGAPGPSLYVAEEIAHNRFKIAGGRPGMKVSWQVTGIRKDPFAEAHRIPVEEEKPANEQGTYLHPKEWGQPEERHVNYQEIRQMREELGKLEKQPEARFEGKPRS